MASQPVMSSATPAALRAWVAAASPMRPAPAATPASWTVVPVATGKVVHSLGMGLVLLGAVVVVIGSADVRVTVSPWVRWRGGVVVIFGCAGGHGIGRA